MAKNTGRSLLMNKIIVISNSYLESYDRFDKESRKIIRKSLTVFAKQNKGHGLR